MKSFFVIKGSPDRWFDQQGYEMEMVSNGSGMVPLVTSKAEDAIGAETSATIDSDVEVNQIRLMFYVVVCKDEQEVIYLAHQQNSPNEL